MKAGGWRWSVGGLGAALLLAVCVGPFRPAQLLAQVVDRVVASVDGEPITLHDVKVYSAASGSPIPGDSDPRAPNMIRRALRELVKEKCLEAETKSFEGQVSEDQVDKFVDNIREKNGLSEEQFKQQLLASGASYEDFRKHARLELEKMMMLDKDVRSKVQVSDSEVKAYYDAHPEEFMVKTERYRLAQILIAVAPNAPPADIAAATAKAKEVDKRAIAGDDFGQLAAQFSDDESKSKGGELGYFAPDEILDEIKAAIAKLKPGEVSNVIQTSHGFHVIKLEEHEQPGVKPQVVVNEEIRDKLIDAKAKDSFGGWLDQDLIKNHHVESFY